MTGPFKQPYAAPAGESPPWGFDQDEPAPRDRSIDGSPPDWVPVGPEADRRRAEGNEYVGHLLEARSSGSPEWLHIARDVSLTLVCLLLIPILAWVVVTGVRVQNTLNDIGDSFTTPSPTPCTFTPDCPGD